MLTPGQQKEHILNRIGYGPSAWASQRYDQLGASAYIAEQLSGSLPPIVQDGVSVATKLERSFTEQRQLETVLVDFWFNHFNVDAMSDQSPFYIDVLGPYQNQAIVPHVLGAFPDMLTATAKSTMMLLYLDNHLNRKPIIRNGVSLGYNENYAREVMELHTLGVNGGYTETDVFEVARVLTGWNFTTPLYEEPWQFKFFPERHDTDEKTVLGVTYPAGGGVEEGETLLNFLANHPSAANFLSAKLCVRFIGEDPPADVMSSAAASYANTNGDLAAVTTTILNHPAFVQADTRHFRSKAKPPHRFAASALMALGATSANQWNAAIEETLKQAIIEAGDTPYFFAPPTGYPESAGYWMSTTSVLARFEMARYLASKGSMVDLLQARTGVDGTDIAMSFAAIQAAVLPGGVSERTRTAILDHATINASTPRQRITAIIHMLLCSPEFMRY